MTMIVYTLFCVNLYLVPCSHTFTCIDFVYLPYLIFDMCIYVCMFVFIHIYIYM